MRTCMNRRNTPVAARVGITWKVYARHGETVLFVERLVNKRESLDENMLELKEHTCRCKS